MINKIKDRVISSNYTLIDTFKKMDYLDKKLLFVFEENKFLSIVSAGDIQRAILNNISLDSCVKDILRDNTRIAHENDDFSSLKETMKKYRMECMPVVNDSNELVDVHFWDEIFNENEKRHQVELGLPVVIMAGGKGTRMRPITNVVPKPLIPLGEETILERIMNSFVEVGCSDFYLSVNYKADLIKYFFEQLDNAAYNVSYFQEDKPLGTAGSLYLIKDKINTTFFVSNCDIMINQDYTEILEYHKENNNELTIVSALKHYPIPYGTIETKKNGVLNALKEKPNLTFQINTGMYILEPHLLSEVPEDEFFHITHLIEKIINRKGRVGVFPVSEGSWKDIGTWDEYLKNQILFKS